MKKIVPIKPLELMDGEFDDFIGVWHNFVPKYMCDQTIELIDKTLNLYDSSNNLSQEEIDLLPECNIMEGDKQFSNKNLGRSDLAIMLNHHDRPLGNTFNQYLQACFLEYLEHHGQLQTEPMISSEMKLQKTEPRGGYHVWHYEDQGWTFAVRRLVWSIYLNDIEDGGETEFLYQSRRVKPKCGTVVIWPAGFTHVHRGNPPLKENKYILTGWYVSAPVF